MTTALRVSEHYEKVWHPEHDMYFFFNKKTGESHWQDHLPMIGQLLGHLKHEDEESTVQAGGGASVGGSIGGGSASSSPRPEDGGAAARGRAEEDEQDEEDEGKLPPLPGASGVEPPPA
jgi:hypothetical protein